MTSFHQKYRNLVESDQQMQKLEKLNLERLTVRLGSTVQNPNRTVSLSKFEFEFSAALTAKCSSREGLGRGKIARKNFFLVAYSLFS